ncbi:uncharacterized protein TEOVI_000364200 [Trypanosoma equiperdum]|uniref:Letm1 RBD domain-containing protein n=3 Tax=Trypanozoon TaxID=39700 RepID=Q38CI8_TRYB2|nr:hypothetical protein, conserved [Trypanosoma brucei gambiense DAL972]XP_822310.1 hypothetical protein, conserved [Trypanosoma brucei brucei TREU927]EAN77482.1 hypothetical protein, conserved [Trypanosoma brucei brucei TREU927]CBH14967.1 hypothetical protein, conserved [Trypanosoma brucei gambiense DAL972]SCU72060.1 hypothetical protein, conserved [Trypanosoma equiperdum]|eukprot:XP_011777233.1 hypothetical protein, conserved [Trypanosoma brucei gambiense DAL972]
MQGSWSVLKKNCSNFFPGLLAFAQQTQEAYGIWLRIYNRQQKYGPTDFVEQSETFSPDYHKRFHSQDKNMWVDKELCTEVSQKEVARLMTYKLDMWRMAHCAGALLATGGYAIPFGLFWLANDTWVPSSFNLTGEELRAWREAQDLYRYRSAPSYLTDTKWHFDFHAYPWNETQERAWDDLFEKNDVRRDPKVVRPAAEMYDGFIKFELIRRKSLRHLCRSMNIPTFPMLARLCNGTRVRDYWNLAWCEDYMVITQRLHESMTDEELYDYAWRRYLAPYDKNLNREQLMERVEDYFEFLGPDFVAHGKAPNLVILTNYVLGYYNDPAYLEGDISELDKNDYDHLASWGKDAFLRRLEFENGPLRDQVEAHTQRLLAERAAIAKGDNAAAVEGRHTA